MLLHVYNQISSFTLRFRFERGLQKFKDKDFAALSTSVTSHYYQKACLVLLFSSLLIEYILYLSVVRQLSNEN